MINNKKLKIQKQMKKLLLMMLILYFYKVEMINYLVDKRWFGIKKEKSIKKSQLIEMGNKRDNINLIKGIKI